MVCQNEAHSILLPPSCLVFPYPPSFLSPLSLFLSLLSRLFRPWGPIGWSPLGPRRVPTKKLVT